MTKTRFEWDEGKDAENQDKHGIPFSLAQYAFSDPARVIAEDLLHSTAEQRYFCFGKVDGGILTVRSPTVAVRSGFLGLVTGAKEKQFMNAKIKYTHQPIEAKVVRDFLPPPEQLAFREEGVKVTLALSKKSVDFFKAEAVKHHTQYQRMLRRLIDAYVETYAQAPADSVPKPARRKTSSS